MSNIFEEVTVSNFLSFGQKPTTFKLNTGKSIAIRGRNLDMSENGNESGNGAGKTSIINAVVFALFGRGIDKIKSDEFINLVNGKKLVVELIFSKANTRYKIRRGRKPNFVELYEFVDGAWQSYTLDAMRNTDHAIEHLIGYTYDNFMASVFLSPHRQSFLSMGATDQRSMIETMLSLDTFAERAETLKVMRSETQSELKLLEKDLERAEQTNRQLDIDIERFSQLSEKFNKDKETDIRRLTELINSLERIDIPQCSSLLAKADDLAITISTCEYVINDRAEKIKTINDRRKKYNDLNKRLGDATTKHQDIEKRRAVELTEASSIVSSYDLSELQDQRDRAITYQKNVGLVRTLTETKKAVEYKLETMRETLDRLETEYEAHKTGKCHVCGGDYVDESKNAQLKSKIDSLKKSIIESSEALKDTNTEIGSIEIEESAKDLDSRKIDGLISVLVDAKRMIETPFVNEMDSTIAFLKEEMEATMVDWSDDALNQMIDDLERSEEMLAAQNAELKLTKTILSEFGVSSNRELERVVDDLTEAKRKLEECFKRSNSFAEEVSTLTNRYVPIDAIKASVDDYRKRETHIGYLIKLMTDSKSFVRKKILDNYIPYLNKKLNEYSEVLGLSHVCEISNDLSVEILYMNRPVSYFLMSRGERMRLDMAATRAFRDMMGMLGKGCNLVLVDEALDSSLDIAGANAAAKFLKESAPDVLVVTHRDDITESMDSKIVMVKDNGFTTIDFC